MITKLVISSQTVYFTTEKTIIKALKIIFV